MKVENMKSRNGNAIPNQFIITDDNGIEHFQSYKTIIAKREPCGCITIDHLNPFSLTTSKYLYKFLNVTRKEFHDNLTGGKYAVADLNS